MLTKWYEITCDKCGGAEHFQGCKQAVKSQAIETGWIIKKE
jgi:hypothetical protein